MSCDRVYYIFLSRVFAAFASGTAGLRAATPRQERGAPIGAVSQLASLSPAGRHGKDTRSIPNVNAPCVKLVSVVSRYALETDSPLYQPIDRVNNACTFIQTRRKRAV